MQQNRASLSTFQIAATYIGTVVGAGFASGQEVLQFFGLFGVSGAYGVAFSGLLFTFFGYLILSIGKEKNAKSHLEVIREANGRLSPVIDLVVTFFLFGGLTAMVAGSGAIFVEQFGLKFWAGSAFMAVASLLTVLSGLHGVINAISLFVPFLIGSVLMLSFFTVTSLGGIGNASGVLPATAPVSTWPASAIIYASYNLLTTSAVLAPVGAQARSSRINFRGALLGGGGLALGALAIHFAVIATLPHSAAFEVPMLYIASRFGKAYSLVYSTILLGEIYTTAVANLYGFSARLAKPETRAFGITAAVSTALTLVASRFGFSNLVRVVYPLAGWAGLLFMAGLVAYYVRRSRAR